MVQGGLLVGFFGKHGIVLLLELIVLQAVYVLTLLDVQIVHQVFDATVQLQELLTFPQSLRQFVSIRKQEEDFDVTFSEIDLEEFQVGYLFVGQVVAGRYADQTDSCQLA